MVAAGLILLNNAVAVVGIFFLRVDLRFVHQWRLVDHKLVQLQRVPYQVLQLLHRQLPRHQVPQLLQRRLPLLQVSLGLLLLPHPQVLKLNIHLHRWHKLKVQIMC
jgi:hypothetical protein